MITQRDYIRHIIDLCARHHIQWKIVDRGYADEADRDDRIIRTRPVKGEITYFTALHEIAHVVAKGCEDYQPTMVCESNAWTWAIKKAIAPPSHRVYTAIAKALRSHYEDQK